MKGDTRSLGFWWSPKSPMGVDRVIRPDLLVYTPYLERWMSFVGLIIQPKLSFIAIGYFYRLRRDPVVIVETNRGSLTDQFPFNLDIAFTGYHEKTTF